MKKEEMKKGIEVVISSTQHTERTHTICSDMKDMKNKIYKISHTRQTDYGLTAIVNGYYWHAKDLTLYKKIKIEKPKIQHFDIKELVT